LRARQERTGLPTVPQGKACVQTVLQALRPAKARLGVKAAKLELFKASLANQTACLVGLGHFKMKLALFLATAALLELKQGFPPMNYIR
jgi:hypothetical protein